LIALLTAGCGLPVAITLLWAAGRLLLAMQDLSAAVVLDRIALALGLVWVLDLVCLVLAQAINSLGPPTNPH
jgi:hypothetical protein